MKSFTKLAIGLVCCAYVTAYAAPNSEISYKNQRGSVLKLVFNPGEQDNTGTLLGTFSTAVGNCEKDMNVPLPISGYYNGNAVTITVNFPHCKQVVAMTGNMTNDQLHTLWLDAYPVNQPRTNDWNSNIVGADSYKRIN